MTTAATTDVRPWYRQYWPWLLIVPPAGAVIGCAITIYLAITHPDVLVRADCHRDGATMVCGEVALRAP
jgi:hypothetical protein